MWRTFRSFVVVVGITRRWIDCSSIVRPDDALHEAPRQKHAHHSLCKTMPHDTHRPANTCHVAGLTRNKPQRLAAERGCRDHVATRVLRRGVQCEVERGPYLNDECSVVRLHVSCVVLRALVAVLGAKQQRLVPLRLATLPMNVVPLPASCIVHLVKCHAYKAPQVLRGHPSSHHVLDHACLLMRHTSAQLLLVLKGTADGLPAQRVPTAPQSFVLQAQ